MSVVIALLTDNDLWLTLIIRRNKKAPHPKARGSLASVQRGLLDDFLLTIDFRDCQCWWCSRREEPFRTCRELAVATFLQVVRPVLNIQREYSVAGIVDYPVLLELVGLQAVVSCNIRVETRSYDMCTILTLAGVSGDSILI